MKIYAIRDKETGKLSSDFSNRKCKFWEHKGWCLRAFKKRYGEKRGFEIVEFELVEVKNDR